MRKILIILCFTIFLFGNIYSQKHLVSKHKKIIEKCDSIFTKNRSLLSLIITKNDSIQIEVVNPNFNNYIQIEEKNLRTKTTRGFRYYKTSKSIKEEYILKEDGTYKGDIKVYDTYGNYIYKWNQQLGTWSPKDIINYPNYNNQSVIKRIADSIVVSQYGKKFFDENIFWNMERSSLYYTKNNYIPWATTDKIDKTYYLFTYDIKYTNIDLFKNKIRLIFDSNLNLIENDSLGFRSCEGIKFSKDIKSKIKQYKITSNEAIKIAISKGYNLEACDSLGFDFNWNPRKKKYVLEFHTRCINVDKQNESYDYREVFIFDPFTGSFIEQKEVSEN